MIPITYRPRRTANGGPLTNKPQFPIPASEPVDPTEADKEALAKAEAKRARKLAQRGA